MALRAKNIPLVQSESVLYANYDPLKINVGPLIKFYTGANPEDRFVGPARIGMARPMEESVALASGYVDVVQYTDNIDWLFFADIRTAATTRVVVMYEYNKSTSQFTWKGYININYPIIGNKTVRGHRVVLKRYTTGTVTVAGTDVTGTGTLWTDSRLCAGSRIGFGSTDPTQITEWREITAVNTNTSITIDSAVIGVTDVPYVIEDLRVLQIITNSTAVNGGLFAIKGLRIENFAVTGTNILAATTDDNLRACYWLSDTIPQTKTLGYGIAIDRSESWTDERIYIVDRGTTTSSLIITVYNHRAALLTLSVGRTTEAFLYTTGQQVTTGTLNALDNGIIVTANHGPGSGIKSLYFTTTTRVYRSDLSIITEGSVNFISDVMVEIPPGGASTFTASSTLSNITYDPTIDRFVIFNTGASGGRSYVASYNVDSNPFEHIFLTDNKQLDQSSADSNSPNFPSINIATFTGYVSGGILYMARISAVATLNQIYAVPISAHQTYAFETGNLLISPKMDISDATVLYEFSVNNIKRLGSDTFAIPTEPFRIFYRTSGIDDNTGLWTQLNDANELSGVSANFIQFALAFRILGTTCIPARIVGMHLLYEDQGTDSHYIPSVNLSSVTNRVFAYRQESAFIGNIPQMRMRIYNASTNALVLDDNSTDQTLGTFEYSTDAINWNPWNATQNLVGNFIRYTAASLPGGIRVRALLTQ